MQRRDFLRSACQACAAMALVPIAATTLESCSSTGKLAVENGLVNVPLSALGSQGRTVLKVNGLSDKVLLEKRPDGTYTALVLNCPHKNGPVKEKGGELVCSWHGSTFDLNGKVTKGPAKSDLKRYPVELVGEVLQVKVA
jgi:nitrite reductase/ring-hydroxylating ferredoxin subunit